MQLYAVQEPRRSEKVRKVRLAVGQEGKLAGRNGVSEHRMEEGLKNFMWLSVLQ